MKTAVFSSSRYFDQRPAVELRVMLIDGQEHFLKKDVARAMDLHSVCEPLRSMRGELVYVRESSRHPLLGQYFYTLAEVQELAKLALCQGHPVLAFNNWVHSIEHAKKTAHAHEHALGKRINNFFNKVKNG